MMMKKKPHGLFIGCNRLGCPQSGPESFADREKDRRGTGVDEGGGHPPPPRIDVVFRAAFVFKTCRSVGLSSVCDAPEESTVGFVDVFLMSSQGLIVSFSTQHVLYLLHNTETIALTLSVLR